MIWRPSECTGDGERRSNALEWAARWIEGSIPPDEPRVREFAEHMAMTIRSQISRPEPDSSSVEDKARAAWRTYDAVLKGKMYAPASAYFVGIVSKALADAVQSAQSASEQEKRDAARYRFIRSPSSHTANGVWLKILHNACNDAEMDAAIDKAMGSPMPPEEERKKL